MSVQSRTVRRVGVLGAGTMGSGISISLALAGYEVILVDSNGLAVSAGMERLMSTLKSSVEKGRLAEGAAAAAIERVQGLPCIEAFEAVDFVIEAVYESLSLKQDVFASLDRVCRPDVILASNTSTLDIDAISQASNRPDAVIGMHFFSPANIMRLVEIVRGSMTGAEAIATTVDITRRMGKLGVIVGNCFGFVGNRMLYAYGRENQLLLLEGATPIQVDKVMEQFGMAMGPNAVSDLAGLDVGYRVRRERKDRPADPRYFRVADMLVESGRLGQKSGKGAFLYAAGSRRPSRDVEVEDMIVLESKRLGIKRRLLEDSEIRDRCLFALINEGAAILSERIAASPADIDAIWCEGFGFPRHKRGPMAYADSLGIEFVLEGIRRFATVLGDANWIAAPLLVEIFEQGETFYRWHERHLGCFPAIG